MCIKPRLIFSEHLSRTAVIRLAAHLVAFPQLTPLLVSHAEIAHAPPAGEDAQIALVLTAMTRLIRGA